MPVDKTCVFCRIASGEIPATKVHQSENVVVFKDAHPQAPEHLLVIPREHFTRLEEVPSLQEEISRAIVEAARIAGIFESGYRVVLNQGSDAGQEVPHIHFHVLGGRRLAWPPG